MPRTAHCGLPERKYPAMNPVTWLLAYFPVLKRSIPSTTYSRQRSVLLPAMRLHSMIACGSWSSNCARIWVNAIGISVIPSGRRALRVERDSVPGNTHTSPPPAVNLALQDLSHAVSQALRHLHFARGWIDFWTLGSSFPPLVEESQDERTALRLDVEQLPFRHDRLRGVIKHQADPGVRTPSLTTSPASSKPQTPSQCRRAAGLMIDTSSRA